VGGDINLGKVKEHMREVRLIVRLQARSHTKGKLRQAVPTNNSGKPLCGEAHVFELSYYIHYT